MTGTESSTQNSVGSPSRAARLLRWGIPAAMVIAAGVAIRQIPMSTATAQAPARPVARPAAPAAQPTARPATPAGQPAAQTATRTSPPTMVAPSKKTLQVMAVVNGEQITRTDLGRECMRRFGNEVLESMLNRQLILDACAAQNIVITEQDVDDEVDRIANKFGLPRDRWLQLLREERGFSEQEYRTTVVWQMIALRRLVADKIQVTPEELKMAFESEFGPKVRARMIAVSSKEKADQVLAAAAAKPESFGDLAKQYCEDPAVASARGVIPPIRMHTGDPTLEQIAFSLKPGELSSVIKVANLYYILLCDEQVPRMVLAPQHIPAQQERLTDKLRENKLRVSAAQFFENMRKSAQVVNVFEDPAKQKAMPGVAATINGRPVSMLQLSEECISRNGESVLEGEINRKLLEQQLAKRKLVITQQDIDAEVARAAASFGFVKADQTPDVERWMKTVIDEQGATPDLYIRDAVWPSVALKKLVGNRVEVTEEDLQKGYESNYGPRVEVLACVLTDQRQAQKVWEMARANPTNDFFAELARQYSVEPSSRSNGGQVPPIRRYGGGAAIEEEAFKLKAGELSGLIAVGDQYIILRCLGRTSPVKADFATVKDELVADIQEKKLRILMNSEFDNTVASAQIDNFLAGTSQSGRTSKVGQLPAIAPAGGPAAANNATRVAPASATAPR